ncbi:hypothetical protein C3K47_11915 [Solitalea longa]|uniref:DUF4062 domain-containing protein n=1 Tax=Solitalea longa TaxID=2079460 RepID=A0A2S5A2E0_9SPHI|nr:DUF4062 domain-containing protein [Solitalea longa]POY36442.1 hypothetical protein C3K47_11915 [Solitalea longa]
MEKINVMISSVGRGLAAERDAIKELFSKNDLIELQGVDPVNDLSFSSSSSLKTIEIAKNCDLYILILSKDFGSKLPDGKSATEVEFDAAFRDDPTKILVFLKNEAVNEEEKDLDQEAFIKKVCDYYKGYWRVTFNYSHELQNYVKKSFTSWIKNRAALGNNLTYLDHFVRLAKQEKPEPNAEVYYSVAKDLVELTYIFFGKTYTIHFSAKEIFNNFWGCMSELQIKSREWTQ